jgi:hypothetical protein
MIKAKRPNTPIPSRRALLAKGGAAVAGAPARGPVANAVAIGMVKTGEVDPIFAAIDHHVEIMTAWFDALRREDATAEYDEPLNEAIGDLCHRECDASFAVVMTQPTTLAGVVALLHHLGQPEYLNMDSSAPGEASEDTILSAWNSSTNNERKRMVNGFPLRLADALRDIVARGQA